MILVFGSINLDLIFPVQHLPAPGETTLGGGFAMLPGGKGANQALAAARDGGRVTLVGAVGRDAFAEAALDLFHVDVPHFLDGVVELALIARGVRVEDEVQLLLDGGERAGRHVVRR